MLREPQGQRRPKIATREKIYTLQKIPGRVRHDTTGGAVLSFDVATKYDQGATSVGPKCVEVKEF